jgi:pyruvate dehydrogenase E2 component (dihydrolipoamide acetyltransferase)
MPRPFTLPDLGEGLQEAEIVKVLVTEGDIVVEDAPLLEVETDKAQVEIPSPFGGRVARVHVQPGQSVRVGEVLVTFDDAPTRAERTATAAVPSARAANAAPEAPRPAATPSPSIDHGNGDRAAATAPVPAAPSTRRLARELGVDLRSVRATGAGGRVTDDDVRAAAGGATDSERGGPRSTAGATAQRPPAGRDATGTPGVETARDESRRMPQPTRARRSDEEVPPGPAKPLAPVGIEPPALPKFEQWGPIERAPLSHLRRTIAERMALSARIVPHVTHFDKADITDLEALVRRNLDRGRERGVTLTLTSFILKAAALSLREHPTFNASLDAAAGEMIYKRYVHLGVAVAAERGLIVPVIRDVDRKPIVELARELAALAARVREGKATLEDLRGGTFTVTNIGALGGTGAIPIINYPEVAILGVARARDEAVVRDGQIVPRLLLPLSLTFDHRVADGADGARFASAIVRRLEHPDELLLEL